MGFSVSNPTYLYQSSSGYIFRFCIPKEVDSKVSPSKQETEGPPMSEAQKRAICNLSKRRGISVEDLEKMVPDEFGWYRSGKFIFFSSFKFHQKFATGSIIVKSSKT